MRAWIYTAATVLLVGLVWFGRSAWGGYFLADDSPLMDIYHLSTLYERWSHYLMRGEFPAWMPEFAGGFPAPASWMYGLYYPGNLLFAALPAGAAWTWTALLHMTLGAVGVHRLVKAETDDDVAAATAGVLFGLSEFMIGRTLYGHLNLVAPLSWAPWVFLHLRGMAEGRRRAAAWCIACAALGLLAGHVQTWFYVAPALLVYALVLGRAPSTRGSYYYVARLGGVALVVALITAPQWMSAVELASLSQRSAESSAEVADYSAPAYVLVAKLFPGALGHLPNTRWGPVPEAHEFGGVGGLLLLALAMPALLRRRRMDWFWAMVAVAGLLLAPGVNNPVSELLGELPPMRWARTPARALLLLTLGATVLAGHGLAEWRRVARETPEALRRLALIAVGAIGIVGAVGAAALFVLLGDHGIGDHTRLVARAVVTSVALAATVVGVPFLARARPRAWLIAPALAAIAAAFGGAPPARTIRSDFYTTDWLSMLPADMREHRVHLVSGRLPNVERQGLRTLREICYMDAHGYYLFAYEPSPQRAVWLDLGVEIEGVPRERVMTGVLGPDDLVGRPYQGLGAGLVFEGALVEPDDRRVLDRIDAGARELHLAAPADGAGRGTSRLVPSARVQRAATVRSGEVALDVDTPVAGWLFVSEKQYPGWTATVNDAPTDIHRANVAFRAVRVPAGRSRVEFVYRPWTVRWGAVLAALGLLATTVIFVRARHPPG